MGNSFTNVYTLFVFLGLVVITCKGANYTIGDSSGWDISTDLDTWQDGKHYVVGDLLIFQYSSSETVNEVTKENYDGCNTTNFIQSYSTGNTTIPLTKPGDRYFTSGNKLYCLGGMKLHVHVDGPMSPAEAPQADSGGSSKSNNPSSIIPNTAVVKYIGLIRSFLFAIMGFASISFLVI